MKTTLNHRKSVFCHGMFVRPADEDYFVGRWALLNGIYPLAFWQISQALEKYLKCSLVLNGVSVRQKGHEVCQLYDVYQKIDDDICINSFRKPDKLHDDWWEPEEVGAFLKKLDAMGSGDSRYGLESWWRRKADLFKFDQLAFQFRRTTIGLSWLIGEDWPTANSIEEEFKGSSWRELLIAKNRYQCRKWDNGFEHEFVFKPKSRKDAFGRLNLERPFGEEHYDGSLPSLAVPVLGPFRNGALYLLAEEYRSLKERGLLTQEDNEFVSWLVENVRFNAETRNFLQTLRS